MESKEELKSLIDSLSDSAVDIALKMCLVLKENDSASKPSETWIGTDEAAKELGVTYATVRNYILCGKLDGRKLSPRKLVVSSESVKRMRMDQSRF